MSVTSKQCWFDPTGTCSVYVRVVSNGGKRPEESWVQGFTLLSGNKSHNWNWPRWWIIKCWEEQVWGGCRLNTPPGHMHEWEDIRDLLVEIVLHTYWKRARSNSEAYGVVCFWDMDLHLFLWATLKIQTWLEVANTSICLHGFLILGSQAL